VDNKNKKIVQTTQQRLDVNLDKKVKNLLLREKVIILHLETIIHHLAVMMADLNHLAVKKHHRLETIIHHRLETVAHNIAASARFELATPGLGNLCSIP
tara:strand:- start:8 stop:304 length:297 start_codon:yes stop_codon:yes gene_type:complete